MDSPFIWVWIGSRSKIGAWDDRPALIYGTHRESVVLAAALRTDGAAHK